MSKEAFWELVPCNDFVLPPAPLQETVERGWKHILDTFRNEKGFSETADDWHVLDSASQKPLNPTFDWQNAANTLLNYVQHDKPNFILAPPYSGLDPIIDHLASILNWGILKSPSRDAVLEGYQSPLPEKPFIIAHLEHFYFRTTDGYSLIRFIIEAASHRPCLLVCSSWAWAFLQHVDGIQLMDFEPLCLKSISAQAWAEWLKQQIPESDIFYHKKNIFEDEDYLYFKRLTSYGRGNSEIIKALWAADLRKSGEKGALHVSAKFEIDWVLQAREELFLLYAILIHGNLTTKNLLEIHPTMPHLRKYLKQLQLAKMIENRADQWFIRARAYPRIREELASERFLLDNF